MQHLTVILHVCDDTVDNHQRLGVGLEAGKSAHKHGVTYAELSAAGYRVDIGSQLFGHQRVDAQMGRIVEVLGTAADMRHCFLTIDGAECGWIKLGIGLAW